MDLFTPTNSKIMLRGYQERAISDCLAQIASNPCLVAPTGSGKTVMGSEIARRHGGRVLWLAHRTELITQAATSLCGLDLQVGIVKAGWDETPSAPVQVASVQTLLRREIQAPDLIIIDECHHATAQSYQTIIGRYQCPRLGLTATPFRLDGRGLGDLFGTIVVAATTRELVEAGILHAPRVYATTTPDLRGVKVIAGDYNLNALSQRVNTAGQNASIVEEWKRHAAGLRTVAFAVDVVHSLAICRAFTDAGIAAEHVDGTTDPETRRNILERLKIGRTQVVSNCMILTEGWDLPALGCAIIARPTASLNLHLQMIGRIMRSCDGKYGALVLDHAGNHHIHGLVTRSLVYSLDGSTRVGHDEPLGLRRCPECGLMYETGAPCCPECKYVIPPQERARQAIDGNGHLVEFDDGNHEYRRSIWNLIEAEREAMNYAPGWSWFRFKERFGVEPIIAEIAGRSELVDPANATADERKGVYRHLLRVAKTKGFKDGFASHRYRDIFGVWPTGFVSRVRDEFRGGIAARFNAKLRGAR
jgi:DNA repair protein RadD